MELKNKNAVVTGGASGIGLALCQLLAQQGANVVVADLNIAAAQSAAEGIGGVAVECDVSKEADIKKLIEQAEQRLGQIDLYCSNAGFGAGEPSHAASAGNDIWQNSWDIHVMAHVWASRALLPQMIERGDGYLLNVASAAGLLVQVGDAAYSATKHAAVSFAESLAIAHGDQGVKVSVVCPQYVNTDILAISDEQRAKPLPGVITPEAAAQSIVDGIEKEQFLILPHPQVHEYAVNRAQDRGRWLSAMRKYRASLLDDNGKFDFAKLFGV